MDEGRAWSGGRQRGGRQGEAKENGGLGFRGRRSDIIYAEPLGLPGFSRRPVPGPAHVPDRAAA
jgi:hypothetical protein